eukprot:5743133-Amphidinium_carterae.2
MLRLAAYTHAHSDTPALRMNAWCLPSNADMTSRWGMPRMLKPWRTREHRRGCISQYLMVSSARMRSCIAEFSVCVCVCTGRTCCGRDDRTSFHC